MEGAKTVLQAHCERQRARASGQSPDPVHRRLQQFILSSGVEHDLARGADRETMSTCNQTPPRSNSFSEPSVVLTRQSHRLEDGETAHVVAVLGGSPPLLSQSPPRSDGDLLPSYSWERTSPVGRKESGLFVLHIGDTPQRIPMSQEPPNVVVNRKELNAALFGTLRGRLPRRSSMVRKRLSTEDELGGLHEEAVVTPNVTAVTRSQLNIAVQGVHGIARGSSASNRRIRSQHRGSGSTARSGGTAKRRIDSLPMPEGWEPPTIPLHLRSPVLLRPRMVAEGRQRDVEDIITVANVMPVVGALTCGRGMCKFSLSDFYPGTKAPNPILRQSIGEHSPWLHDCGEPECPFMEHTIESRASALREGCPIPEITSPGDHIRVDARAFPIPVHVLVKLQTLGIDSTLWGDLQHFSGLVVGRYYHLIHGAPMYKVDFGGGIGVQNVKVEDTDLDHVKQFGGVARALDFSNGGDQGGSLLEQLQGNNNSGDGGLYQSQHSDDNSEADPDWCGDFEDFVDSEGKGTPSPSKCGSFPENPVEELGLYNAGDDLSGWPFERLFADNQWQETKLSLVNDMDNFSGPMPGPTMPRVATELEYFRRYWPDEVLERIVRETDRYAHQACHSSPHLSNGRSDWANLSTKELLCWFGILILMGLKDEPSIRCYWNPKPFYCCPIISRVMTRRRFEAITRCVHLVNNNDLVTNKLDPAYDKIGKVRWLVESFARISQSLYNPERTLTVDEIMIGYKGSYCEIRQYMKGKPTQFGIKVWAVACAQSRYIFNVIVYLGSTEARSNGDSVGEDAVLTSIRGLEGRGHVVVMDNYFTSPQLFMTLLERGFLATGTVRKTRRGFPDSLGGFPKSQLPKRGTLAVRMHRSRRICAICWIDSKPVFLLSTACNPCDEEVSVGRWVGREHLQFPTSPILIQYQSNMRGVDVVDQKREEYTIQLQSHKWWHKLFLFVLDSSILNSYSCYEEDERDMGLALKSRQLWHYNLGMALVQPYMEATPSLQRGGIRNMAPRGVHRIQGHPTDRGNCGACGQRTRRICEGCGGMFMCDGACYIRLHTQALLRRRAISNRGRRHPRARVANETGV